MNFVTREIMAHLEELDKDRTRAQRSRAAIERLYVAMRHLFIRGGYKPMGVSGEAMIQALMTLRPEIYGSITDPEKVELEGLHYVIQRLPTGIEECRYIRLVSKEGFDESKFRVLIPPKRRRNCYRIDDEQMYIEMTRGRSDIYDILTHLTFLYIEAEKIRNNSMDHKDRLKREWHMLGEIVERESQGEEYNKEVAYTYLSNILGRTFEETREACLRFEDTATVSSLFRIAYWLGRRSIEEYLEEKDREVTFSATLRDRIGHHIYGERWATNLKHKLLELGMAERPIHIVSANMHSVMNSLYGPAALQKSTSELLDIAETLSQEKNQVLRGKVRQYALKNGMYSLEDSYGTNLEVQIYDTVALPFDALPVPFNKKHILKQKPVLLVMDYAFGEQAYETMDELLKPHETEEGELPFLVQSISIMGKAGILTGSKGDIMVPTAFVFEGTADNYPVENEFSREDFSNSGFGVFEGPMITVLGTSLQNKDILQYFLKSSWKAIGLEMEGAHYQKAIQIASKIRHNINPDVTVRYAYYASDNPLITGATLASGSMGVEGVKPTYLITLKILRKIMSGR